MIERGELSEARRDMRFLKRLYELPPREVVRKAKRRLLPSSGDGVDLDEVLHSPKHMRHQKFYDFLSRYEAILERTHGWPWLRFEGKRVLEIGCGPLMGFGPLAVFQGSEVYAGIEPMFSRRIFTHRGLIDKYFLGVYKDLSGIHGPRMTFDEFMADLQRKATVITRNVVDAELEGPFDVVLSNSCLEHVFPFADTIRKLRDATAPECRFIHLVDFGNHRPTKNPFDGMYCVEPDEYMAKFGRQINLLRAPDVLDIFRQSGFDAGLVPYYKFREFHKDRICPYWSEKYSEDDLFLKTAIIFGPVSGLPGGR